MSDIKKIQSDLMKYAAIRDLNESRSPMGVLKKLGKEIRPLKIAAKYAGELLPNVPGGQILAPVVSAGLGALSESTGYGRKKKKTGGKKKKTGGKKKKGGSQVPSRKVIVI